MGSFHLLPANFMKLLGCEQGYNLFALLSGLLLGNAQGLKHALGGTTTRLLMFVVTLTACHCQGPFSLLAFAF